MTAEKAKLFENITMNGRMCYIFMCIERYLLSLYPDRDWTPAAKRMWDWSAVCWSCDDELDRYIQLIPECILEFNTYEAANAEWYGKLPRKDYDELVALYKGITTGAHDDEINRVFLIPNELWKNCDGSYYDIETGRVSTLRYIDKIEEILISHDILLPDITLLSAYTVDHADPDVKHFGYYDVNRTDHYEWGFGKSGAPLSLII